MSGSPKKTPKEFWLEPIVIRKWVPASRYPSFGEPLPELPPELIRRLAEGGDDPKVGALFFVPLATPTENG
jgi:hypothetical protein